MLGGRLRRPKRRIKEIKVFASIYKLEASTYREKLMKTIIHSINGNTIAEIIDDGIILKNVQDFLDIAANIQSRTLLFYKENIVPEFFDLKTKIAGDILQKASNYRIRIGIIGNFENIKSKSLNDFIYESNKTGEVLFKVSIEEVIEQFSR